MVQTNSRLPRRWIFAATTFVSLLIAATLTACGSQADNTPTVAPTATTTTTSPQPLASTSTPTTSSDPTATTEPSEEPASVETISPDALASEVTTLVSQVEGLVEVVIALPDGSTVTEINGYEPMEAASLYKLAILVEVFTQRETGELSFDEEIEMTSNYFAEEDSVFSEGDIGGYVAIETLLDTMITLSSNVAATALLDRVGNENVNLTMASLGLESTEIRWSPRLRTDEPVEEDIPAEEAATVPVEEAPTEETVEDAPTEEPVEEVPTEEESSDDEGTLTTNRRLLGNPILLDPRADAALNVTTAADVAALYVMLVNGQLVSESASQEMLALLEQQQINDRLPAYLPADTIVAHKTGNLDGLVHDAGVIFAPAGPVVVVVMTEDVEEWQAIDLIATIAQLAYESGLQPPD